MNRKYTKEILEEAVKESKSFADVARIFNVRTSTGGCNYLISVIKKFKIDTSHFTGQGWSKGKVLGYQNPLEDYLTNKRKITSWKLKNRLFKENIFDKVCSSCNNREWLGEEIPLELDHINGNKLDNSLENLRILCPNCHAKTDTYKSKNRNTAR